MKKKTKKRLIILASIAGLFLILAVVAVEFTSHSGFCAACHYMKPFFQSWETSSHGHVECNACHYPPSGGIRSTLRKKIEGLVMVGRYWTKLYLKSKPWAEIRDESCLMGDCHDRRLLEGKVQFKKVAFDHKIHFEDLKRGKQLQCTSCHSQIVQGEHITVTESSCFICHFKESEHYPQIKECYHCHTEELLTNEETSRFNHSLVFTEGFTCDKCHSNTILGNGEVPRENCYKCHWETERLDKYDDTDLMHTLHIYENKIECNQCHMEIQHKINKDIETIADCQTCHPDHHRAQKVLFTGEGGSGIDHPIPNIMLEKGLSCKGCHIYHEEKGKGTLKVDTLVSEAKACEDCHGKGFSLIMKDWEVSTIKKLGAIRSIYNDAQQRVKRSKSSNKPKALTLLEESTFNIELVDKGKSVHNMEFSQELLSASYDKILEALRIIGSTYKPEKFSGTAKEIPTQCSNCHAGIEEISIPINGFSFPHKHHLLEQKIQCDTCHSNVRKHGEFIATKQTCALCHHKDPEKDCASCHKLQSTFYQGGTTNGHDVPQDIMFAAEVGCTGCHLSEQNNIYRSGKQKCLDCHEKEYGEIYSEWQNSVKDLTGSITASLKEKKKLKLTGQEKDLISNIEQTVLKIKQDGSSGIHNYIFIDEILTNFMKKIESIGEATE